MENSRYFLFEEREFQFSSFGVPASKSGWQEVLSVWNSLIKWSNWPVGLGGNQEAAEFIAMKDEESKNQMCLNQK